MRAGRIVAQGSPDAMLDPRHLQETFGVPMLRIAHLQTGAPMCVPAYDGAPAMAEALCAEQSDGDLAA
jgi:iron complex transport system ATP-binding protein